MIMTLGDRQLDTSKSSTGIQKPLHVLISVQQTLRRRAIPV